MAILSFNLSSDVKNAVISPVTVSAPLMETFEFSVDVPLTTRLSEIVVVPPLESIVISPDVVLNVLPSNLILSTSSLPVIDTTSLASFPSVVLPFTVRFADNVVFPVTLNVPATLPFPPIKVFPPMPTPPVTTRAPD